jgi:GT2 family glycosyltransferase
MRRSRAIFGARVRLLRLPRNLGSERATITASAPARGRYVLLLNNDAVAAPTLARELGGGGGGDPHVGMVRRACARLRPPRRHRQRRPSPLSGWPEPRRGRLEVDRGQYAACRTALFPSGGRALSARDARRDRLFDEAFFLYGDDAELGLRGRVAGGACALAPDAVAYHRYSRSSGAYSTLKAFYVERNRVLVLLKLFPLRLVLVSPFYTALRFLLQAWGAVSGRGAAGRLARERSIAHLAWVTLRAYASALAAGAARPARAPADTAAAPPSHGAVRATPARVSPRRARGGAQGLIRRPARRLDSLRLRTMIVASRLQMGERRRTAP